MTFTLIVVGIICCSFSLGWIAGASAAGLAR